LFANEVALYSVEYELNEKKSIKINRLSTSKKLIKLEDILKLQ